MRPLYEIGNYLGELVKKECRMVYRKQYVPDYLVQKKINNHGAVDKVYVEGSHEKLVSPEDFDRAQELREKHKSVKTDKNGKAIGQSPCKHLWGNKACLYLWSCYEPKNCS